MIQKNSPIRVRIIYIERWLAKKRRSNYVGHGDTQGVAANVGNTTVNPIEEKLKKLGKKKRK